MGSVSQEPPYTGAHLAMAQGAVDQDSNNEAMQCWLDYADRGIEPSGSSAGS